MTDTCAHFDHLQDQKLFDYIDHLVLAVPDLKIAMDEMHQRLGIQPVMGGRHPVWGTWNALLAVGEATYLELIAPDPDNHGTDFHRPEIFSATEAPRMIGWFAKCSQLESARAVLDSEGIQIGDIKPGSRVLPDGRKLQWQLTDPEVMVFDGIFPMLIDWADSPHPAESAPVGCRLLELHLEHPEGGAVTRLLAAIGISIEVQTGSAPCISAVIETPMGTLQLP